MSKKSLPDIVPAPAKMLLDFIRSFEAPQGYDTIYGNNQNKLPVRLTLMTLDQVIADQAAWSKRFGSSAAGGLQFMRATLQQIKEDTGVSGDLPFSAGLQDRLGYYLLLGRGFSTFLAGTTSVTAFGKALAQEWASFPVLEDTMGAHRMVRRGETYYAGDALNKVLVTPEKVIAKLGDVLALARSIDKTQSAKVAPAALIDAAELPTESAPADPQAAVPAETIDPQRLDKPMVKSKTVWQWVLTAAGAPLVAFGGFDWRVQLAIVAVIVCFAIYAIKRRRDLAIVYRDIKQELGS